MDARRWIGLVALLGGVTLAATGCYGPPTQPMALSVYGQDRGDTASWYIVEQPDALQIEVADNPALSRSAQLRPDGRITMPLLGDVSVTGLTSMEIREKLTKRYEKYLKQVDITVTVSNFASKSVFIFRERGSASIVPYTGRQTFMTVMARAGGPGGEAATHRIRLVRCVGGQVEIRKVNLYDIAKRGYTDEIHNPTMRDGDIIYIEMDNPSRIAWEIEKIMAPITALLSPVRQGMSWAYTFGAMGA